MGTVVSRSLRWPQDPSPWCTALSDSQNCEDGETVIPSLGFAPALLTLRYDHSGWI